MENRNGKALPHHRMTVGDVVRDFHDGLLTAKGAIFYAVSAARKQGEPMRVNPANIAKVLGIKRTTYYRALASLTTEKRLEFEAHELAVKVPIDKEGKALYLSDEEKSQITDSLSQITDSLSQIPDSLSQIPDSQSQIPDSQSQIWDSLSQIPDSLSQIPDSQSQIWENRPLEPAPSNGSSASPIIQSIQSIQNIEERERSAGEEEENDRDFKNWLINKANSLPQKPALMEQWIEKEMVKAANKREFAQYQETRVATPIPAILPQEDLTPQDYWAAVEARRNGNG